jgi:hypothetical protein
MSTVINDDPEFSKKVFIVEPSELDLKVNDVP